MVIIDIDNLLNEQEIKDEHINEKLKAHAWLMSEVSKGVRSYEEKGSVSAEEIIKYFEEKHKDD